MSKLKMQAPKGCEGSSANIEGHEYSIPKNGKLNIVSPLHVETLRRHGFTDILQDEVLEKDIDEMDDKDELVTFIEERGGSADNSMKLSKLRRLAKAAANPIDEDEE